MIPSGGAAALWHDRIAALVERSRELDSHKHSSRLSASELGPFERGIGGADQESGEPVYEVYGIPEEAWKTVEGSQLEEGVHA